MALHICLDSANASEQDRELPILLNYIQLSLMELFYIFVIW